MEKVEFLIPGPASESEYGARVPRIEKFQDKIGGEAFVHEFGYNHKKKVGVIVFGARNPLETSTTPAEADAVGSLLLKAASSFAVDALEAAALAGTPA